MNEVTDGRVVRAGVSVTWMMASYQRLRMTSYQWGSGWPDISEAHDDQSPVRLRMSSPQWGSGWPVITEAQNGQSLVRLRMTSITIDIKVQYAVITKYYLMLVRNKLHPHVLYERNSADSCHVRSKATNVGTDNETLRKHVYVICASTSWTNVSTM